MATKYADIRIELTVKFEDDGENDLKDQAIEAVLDKLGALSVNEFEGIEVVGEVRETETPCQT